MATASVNSNAEDEPVPREELENPPASYRSKVWRYFGFPVHYEEGSRRRVVSKTHTACRLCYMRVPYPPSGNTTNMAQHLSRHHKDLKETQNLTLTQPSIKDTIKKKEKFPPNSARAKEINSALAVTIGADMRPLSLVQSHGFRYFCRVLEPRWQIPGRFYVTRTLMPDLYENVKAEIVEGLRCAESIAITTDGWTSRATESYITVTAHYLNEDWEMKNHVLQTLPIYEAHTSDNLSDVLTNAAVEWKLERPNTKIPVTTDNAKNVVNATMRAGMSPQIGCFAHTVNLATQKSLDVNQMSRILSKVRKIVGFFHRSTTAAAVYDGKQKDLKLPDHKLIHDVKTRWNSSLEMIERYLEQQAAVYAALTEDSVKKNVKDLITLSDSDIKVMEAAVEVLKPLKTVTTTLSSEKKPTVSLIHPLHHTILTSMRPSGTDLPTVRDMKNAIAANFKDRYSDPATQQFLKQSTALDPRFKSLPHLDDVSQSEIFKSLAEKILQQHPTRVCGLLILTIIK